GAPALLPGLRGRGGDLRSSDGRPPHPLGAGFPCCGRPSPRSTGPRLGRAQNSILVIVPFTPTSQPFFSSAKATAQNPVTPSRRVQLSPSSGLQAVPAGEVATTVAFPWASWWWPWADPPRSSPCSSASSSASPSSRSMAYAAPKIAPAIGARVVSFQVPPLSWERAKLSTMPLAARSPPAAKPWCESRNPTLNAPPADSVPTVSGTSAAVQV